MSTPSEYRDTFDLLTTIYDLSKTRSGGIVPAVCVDVKTDDVDSVSMVVQGDIPGVVLRIAGGLWVEVWFTRDIAQKVQLLNSHGEVNTNPQWEAIKTK